MTKRKEHSHLEIAQVNRAKRLGQTERNYNSYWKQKHCTCFLFYRQNKGYVFTERKTHCAAFCASLAPLTESGNNAGCNGGKNGRVNAGL